MSEPLVLGEPFALLRGGCIRRHPISASNKSTSSRQDSKALHISERFPSRTRLHLLSSRKKMTRDTDLEAGEVRLPNLPTPVYGGGSTNQVTQGPQLEPNLHATISSSGLQLPSSSAREQVPTPTQPRRRKKIEKEPSPAAKIILQPATFFDSLQAELENGARSHCLFMCWEVGINDRRAVPLLIDEPDNEVQIYRDMAVRLDETQPWWLRYNPFYQVIAVEEVEVCEMNLAKSIANSTTVSLSEKAAELLLSRY